jgi:hypothetical protein
MGIYESKLLVEAERVGSLFVGGELDQVTVTLACPPDRPQHRQPADASAAHAFPDSYCFNLGAPAPLKGERGDISDLECADDPTLIIDNNQLIIGVGLDFIEGFEISFGERRASFFALAAEMIIG